MEGYLRPRLLNSVEELRTLTFEDTEFVPDDEPNPIIQLRQHFATSGYVHFCPRCSARNLVVGRFPYCPDCNWDSLVDDERSFRCAA